MSFTVRFSRHGGSLLAEVSGLYTSEAAMAIRDKINQELAHRHAVKALMDLRKAVVLIPEDDWCTLLENLGRCPIAAPLGMLVDEESMQQWCRRCMRMVERGFTRLAFDDPAQAARWSAIPAEALASIRPFVPVTSAGE